MAVTLSSVRKDRNISLGELGRAVLVTRGQLSRIERGQSRPSARTTEKLFEFFGGAISKEQLMFPDAASGGKKPVRAARPEAGA